MCCGIVADVEYRDVTSEGLLRASSFKGCPGNRGSREGHPPTCSALQLHRVQLIAEDAFQYRASCVTRGRYHSRTAVQKAGDTVHWYSQRRLRNLSSIHEFHF